MAATSSLLHRMITIVLAGVLTACAAPNKGNISEADHKAHHPQSSTAVSPGSSGMAQMGMMSEMDMKTMCDMHKNMMSSKTPAEREAMMDQHMKSMSPEMRQKHMSMMDAKCR